MADERLTVTYDHARWRELVAKLARVSFLPASWDKRFARDLAIRAQDPEASISEKQFAMLCRLVHKYRRQL